MATLVCPSCGSKEIEVAWKVGTYMMDLGGKIYRCKRCGYTFAKLGIVKFKKGQLG